jgi:hypothetical protein
MFRGDDRATISAGKKQHWSLPCAELAEKDQEQRNQALALLKKKRGASHQEALKAGLNRGIILEAGKQLRSCQGARPFGNRLPKGISPVCLLPVGPRSAAMPPGTAWRRR